MINKPVVLRVRLSYSQAVRIIEQLDQQLEEVYDEEVRKEITKLKRTGQYYKNY